MASTTKLTKKMRENVSVYLNTVKDQLAKLKLPEGSVESADVSVTIESRGSSFTTSVAVISDALKEAGVELQKSIVELADQEKALEAKIEEQNAEKGELSQELARLRKEKKELEDQKGTITNLQEQNERLRKRLDEKDHYTNLLALSAGQVLKNTNTSNMSNNDLKESLENMKNELEKEGKLTEELKNQIDSWINILSSNTISDDQRAAIIEGINGIGSKLESNEELIEKMRETITKEFEEKYKDYVSPEDHKKELEDLQKQLQEKPDGFGLSTKDIAELEAENAKIEKQIAAIKNDIAENQQELTKANAYDYNDMDSYHNYSKLNARSVELSDQLQELQSKLDENNIKLYGSAFAKDKIEGQKEEITSLNEQIGILNKEIEDLRTQLDAAGTLTPEKERELKNQLEQKDADLEKLKEQLELVREVSKEELDQAYFAGYNKGKGDAKSHKSFNSRNSDYKNEQLKTSYSAGYGAGYADTINSIKVSKKVVVGVGVAGLVLATGLSIGLGVPLANANKQIKEDEGIFENVAAGSGLLLELMEDSSKVDQSRKDKFLENIEKLKSNKNSNVKLIGENLEGMYNAALEIGSIQTGHSEELKAYLDFIYQLQATKNIYYQIVADYNVTQEEKDQLNAQISSLNSYESAAIQKFNMNHEYSMVQTKAGILPFTMDESTADAIGTVFSTAASYYELKNSTVSKETYNADIAEKQAEIDAKDTEIAAKQAEIAAKQAEIASLEGDKSALEADKAQLEKDKAQLEKDKAQLEKDKEKLEKDFATKEQQYIGLMFETNGKLVDMLTKASAEGFTGFKDDEVSAFTSLAGYTDDIKAAYQAKYNESADFATDFKSIVDMVNSLASKNVSQGQTIADQSQTITDYVNVIDKIPEVINGLYTMEDGKVVLKPVYTIDSDGNVVDNSSKLLESLANLETESTKEGLNKIKDEFNNMLKGTGSIQLDQKEYEVAINQINASIAALDKALENGAISEADAKKLHDEYANEKSKYTEAYITDYLNLIESIQKIDNKSAEIIQGLKDDIKDLNDKLQAKQDEIDNLNDVVVPGKEAKIKELEDDIVELNKKIAELNDKLAGMDESAIADLNKQLEEHKKSSTFVYAVYNHFIGEPIDNMNYEDMMKELSSEWGLIFEEIGGKGPGVKDEFNNQNQRGE